jgi:CBS domain-containing protein
MSAGRICSRVVATASSDETVGAAARRMAEYDVGTVVIVEGGRANRAVGILTDRDIAIRCISEQRDPESTPVSEIMTRPVQSVGEHTPIEQAVARMASAGTRRLVVTGEADRVVGILGLDDILDLLTQEATAVGRLLEKQQPRIPA